MEEKTTSTDSFFASNVLGHPSGLFVLFFTEMWERFSYYGMRALLVLFLVSPMGLDGWDWPRGNALALYGTYTALVYITPILGGYLADRFIGYRKAVVIGALIMTLGHASMAIEEAHLFLYLGIALLIVGNGFFKPNMTSIISHMYAKHPEKKDGAYTIFYMGVNAGAFLGILMCGYLGEKVGWSYGFGLAGIFMLLGMIQFRFSQSIFGKIGERPAVGGTGKEKGSQQLAFEGDRLNPFTPLDKFLIAFSSIIGIVWVLNDPISKINGFNLLLIQGTDYSDPFILMGLGAFFTLLVSRIIRYPKITRDRMLAIVFFALMTIIFWMSFEQAGGSMTIFAKDYTNRVMTGGYYYAYVIVNIIITVVPIVIITWVLYRLIKATYHQIKWGNITLGISFLLIWGVVFWIIRRDLNSSSYEVTYSSIVTPIDPIQYNRTEERAETLRALLKSDAPFAIGSGRFAVDSIVSKTGVIRRKYSTKEEASERQAEQQQLDEQYALEVMSIQDTESALACYTKDKRAERIPVNKVTFETILTEDTPYHPFEKIVQRTATIIEPVALEIGHPVDLFDIDKRGGLSYLTQEKAAKVRRIASEKGRPSSIVKATVTAVKANEVEIPATWFLILNSLFIIMFAPLFSRWWESKFNPSASAKYGLGLILLGIGFGALAFGSLGIEPGTQTASVSMVWLVLAYLFHTLGELCLSPVALSYISKLVPGRMIAMMFGVWYIAVAIGNKLAGLLGGKIDAITEDYDMATFFLIFTVVPGVLGGIAIVASPLVKKWMHGVK